MGVMQSGAVQYTVYGNAVRRCTNYSWNIAQYIRDRASEEGVVYCPEIGADRYSMVARHIVAENVSKYSKKRQKQLSSYRFLFEFFEKKFYIDLT